MHHASHPHKYDNPPAHAFALPREGALTDLLRQAFPAAWFNEDHQEWWIDWDESDFPDHGKKLDTFATAHNLEIEHRYAPVADNGE